MKQELKDNKKKVSELLSRGDAIKKIGGYAALTALSTFMILNPQKAQAFSIDCPGGGGGFPCDDCNPNTCCDACYDGNNGTQCPTLECDGSIDFITGDCNTGTPCPPGGGDPFQGNGNNKSNTTNKINFDPKYNTKYKLKYSKK
ncbi:hypothetical protein N9375_01350 [Flavobacteriaceae bacterium]|nr:hypothetical protein [Flavobacteriaceae bacterium]